LRKRVFPVASFSRSCLSLPHCGLRGFCALFLFFLFGAFRRWAGLALPFLRGSNRSGFSFCAVLRLTLLRFFLLLRVLFLFCALAGSKKRRLPPLHIVEFLLFHSETAPLLRRPPNTAPPLTREARIICSEGDTLSDCGNFTFSLRPCLKCESVVRRAGVQLPPSLFRCVKGASLSP